MQAKIKHAHSFYLGIDDFAQISHDSKDKTVKIFKLGKLWNFPRNKLKKWLKTDTEILCGLQNADLWTQAFPVRRYPQRLGYPATGKTF